MKRYEALTCHADRDTLDLLTAVSGTLPITGIVDNDTNITLYFEADTFDDTIIETLRGWVPEATEVEFERGSVEEQNWNAEFERSLVPVRLTDRLVITQSWNPVSPSRDDELVVVIDPKMSFGTGHHESTRLIARLMMRMQIRGKRVVDVGCGTGVLAIVAARHGAASVVALDNNEWAVENTLENIRLNDAPDIEVVQGELADLGGDDVDLFLANIHRNVIMDLLPTFAARLSHRSDAALLTSGVLIVDHESLVDAARRHGLVPVDEERENEWIATEFRREQ